MTSFSSTALAALEKLCEAAPNDAQLARWVEICSEARWDNESVPALKARAVYDQTALSCFANAVSSLRNFRNAFPSLAATIRASEARIEEEERAHSLTIDQRDAAEEAVSQAYLIVTGQSAEWSSLFGFAEALTEIDETHSAVLAQRDAALAEVERLKDRREYWENNFWNERKCAIAARKQRDEAIAEVAKLSGAAS